MAFGAINAPATANSGHAASTHPPSPHRPATHHLNDGLLLCCGGGSGVEVGFELVDLDEQPVRGGHLQLPTEPFVRRRGHDVDAGIAK